MPARPSKLAVAVLAAVAVIATSVTTPSIAAAASAPVARDDVARTNNGAQVTVQPLGNDFDLDGDSFSIVSVATPAHGTITSFFSNGFYYLPTTGYFGPDIISYTIQDSTGATDVGQVTVWVDSGVAGPQSPDPGRDYLAVYQGSSTTFTTADLLVNDSDPQGQPLTVVAVSEPSYVATLTGTVGSGSVSIFVAVDPTTVDTDHDLEYLVIDTDGHVTQQTITVRILAAGDTNQAPVARADVDRTNNGVSVQVLPLGNDYDPDGDSFSIVSVDNPAHGNITSFFSNGFYYLPTTGYSGTDTITYTIRDSHGLIARGHVTVYVDTGTQSSAQSPDLGRDYLVVYQGSSTTFTAADLLINDSDPQGQTLTVVAVSEPSNVGTLTGTVTTGFVYTPNVDPTTVNTDHDLEYLVIDTDGHVTQQTITVRILAAGDTNQAPVARADVDRTNNGVSVQVLPLGNDYDPDGDSFSIVSVDNPAHGNITSFFSNGFYYLPDHRLLRHRHHHLHHPRLPRPHRQRPRDGVRRYRDAVVGAEPGSGAGLSGRVSRLVDHVHRCRPAHQRQRPTRPNPHRRCGLGTLQRRHPHRHRHHRIRVHPQRRPHHRQHRPRPRVPRHRHRRPRHPTNHHRADPRRRRHQPGAGRAR